MGEATDMAGLDQAWRLLSQGWSLSAKATTISGMYRCTAANHLELLLQEVLLQLLQLSMCERVFICLVIFSSIGQQVHGACAIPAALLAICTCFALRGGTYRARCASSANATEQGCKVTAQAETGRCNHAQHHAYYYPTTFAKTMYASRALSAGISSDASSADMNA